MTPTSEPLRVVTLGGRAIATALDEETTAAGRPLTATTHQPDELAGSGDPDCILVDQRELDGWRSVVDRATETRPSVPVVVLVATAAEDAVATAIKRGARSTLPRSVCTAEPAAAATHIGRLVSGDRDSRAQETNPERESDDRLRLVADNVDEIIYVANWDFSEVEYVNPAYEAVWGRPVEPLYDDATAFMDGIDPRDREEFEADFDAMRADIRNGTPAESYEFEFRVRQPDGEIRWVTATGYPVTTETGKKQYVGIVEDVTDRRELKRTYRELFESVSDGIVVHDPETGEIVDVNEQFCAMNGYDREELLGETVELTTPDNNAYSYDSAREKVKRAAKEGPQLFEWHNERKSGETFPVEVSLRLATLQGEQRVLASVRDITERRERQSQLETERDRLSVLFENTPDPIMGVKFVDSDPYITEVNEAFETEFGKDAADITDRPIAAAIVPDDEREGYEDIRQQALAGDPVEREVRRETADGIRDFLLRVLPFESGGDRHAYVWFTDVTEGRERERAIEEERQKYSTLVEQSTDGVVVVRDGEYVFVNERFTEITEYDESELLGMPIEQVFVPESRELIRDRYERRVAGESPPNQYDVEVETATGERRTLELAVSRIQHEGDPATMATFRDVTDRKERERTVNQLQVATERLQSVDTTEAVFDIAVETARDVLGLPMTACWRYDDEHDRLTYTAGTEPVEEMETGPVEFTPGDREYEVFQAGEPTTYDPSKHHSHNPLEQSLIVPVGDEGLLAAGERGRQEFEQYLIDVMGVLAGHAASAIERVQRAEQLRESERRLGAIIDRIDEAIFLAPAAELTTTNPAAEFVSSGYEDIWGQSLERIQETHDEGFFSTLHPKDRDDYRALVEEIVADVEHGEPRDRYTCEYRIERPDGDWRWVRSEFYPTAWPDGHPRIIIASRDVTDRKEREQTLETFHDATNELTTAETTAEASTTAVEAAASVFGLPATAVYRYDDETGRLDPAASGPELPPAADLGSLGTEHDAAWGAFIDEQLRRVDNAADALTDDVPDGAALLFPLGGNGLLTVWRSDETFDTDAANILAATLEAALNRLRGEHRLESRRAELEAQTERARRLESIAELTQRVEAAITTRSSREGIQESVCAELTDVEPFEAACVVEADIGSDRLQPRAVAGIARDDVEELLLDAAGDASPAARAWETEEAVVSNDLVGSRRQGGWRKRLLRDGIGSVCAVPLSYEDVTHGVLTIFADEPDAFGERTVDVISQLGTSIGYAITATERRRALESDDTLELEFQGENTDLPMARLARTLGCRVSHQRTVHRQDSSISVYYRLAGDVPTEVAEPAENVLPGDLAVVSRGADEAVIERRGSSWFGSYVSEYGGIIRRARGTAEGVTLVVEIPTETDTRTMVERVQDEFSDLELYAQRQHRETRETAREIQDRLQRELSDRQYEALETAQAMGYFEWPRENSGEDVADALGITQPTLNKHVRLGERTVFEILFGSNDERGP
ncbi:PAS domain S-box protein [Haloarcula sp. CBA1130]|uniref:PAS domain S-box protein n=1 Tax=unclassified Haloarcula TaxID=2624677 RepID=UPI001249424B|nr:MULTISPECIES: PAS domain S-box protein [unclassified Haloarcula]KAA9395803.1 PAS domain S-box protein [Haloarcula sp. CBA1129]KAA9400265.1 PAS domain S-box protein [Haloarcula sp. CBA1130]